LESLSHDAFSQSSAVVRLRRQGWQKGQYGIPGYPSSTSHNHWPKNTAGGKAYQLVVGLTLLPTSPCSLKDGGSKCVEVLHFPLHPCYRRVGFAAISSSSCDLKPPRGRIWQLRTRRCCHDLIIHAMCAVIQHWVNLLLSRQWSLASVTGNWRAYSHGIVRGP